MLKLKVKVITREVSKDTDKHKKGEKFDTYKVLTKNGWRDLMFTKEVKERPTKMSYINVLEENLNVNNQSEYITVWVSKIESIEEVKPTFNKIDYFE